MSLGTIVIATKSYVPEGNGVYRRLAETANDKLSFKTNSGTKPAITDPSGLIIPVTGFGCTLNHLYFTGGRWETLTVQTNIIASNNITDANLVTAIANFAGAVYTAGNILQLRSGNI